MGNTLSFTRRAAETTFLVHRVYRRPGDADHYQLRPYETGVIRAEPPRDQPELRAMWQRMVGNETRCNTESIVHCVRLADDGGVATAPGRAPRRGATPYFRVESTDPEKSGG